MHCDTPCNKYRLLPLAVLAEVTDLTESPIPQEAALVASQPALLPSQSQQQRLLLLYDAVV